MTSISSSDNEPFIIDELEDRAVADRNRDFSDLLEKIDNIDDKKKKLWHEIYRNSLTDRHNSYVLFKQLVNLCTSATTQVTKSTEFATHGSAIARLLDQMRRANEQLIKLAALIAQAEKDGNSVDPDSVFDMIQRKKGAS